MAALLIRCPKTGKPVHTGLDLPPQVFVNSEFSNNRVTCPHCDGVHTWDKKDAFLEGDVSQPPHETN